MTAAVWGPPWNLRLVVLDAETCVAPDKNHRFVSLGIAVCRADEPTFDEILPDIRRVIAGRPGETVVLAAHNAGFDVGWLRTEVARVGAAELPDLAILDTQGAILGLAGLSVRRPRLETLLAALDLGNEAAHTALGDASATAHAAIALPERAEVNGHADLDALLAAAGGATSGSIPRKNTKATGRAPRAVVVPPIPPGHVATHAGELPAKPTSAQLAEWRTWIRECATHRCVGLGSRVAPEPLFRGLLLEALEATAAAGDRAGTATRLGALRPMLGRLPGSIAEMRRHGPPLTRITGAGNQRGVALALHAWLAPRLDPLGRCPAGDPCPACRDGEPCPLDTWRTALVPSALGPKPSQVNAFWNTTGQASAAAKGAGRGYLSMRHNAPRARRRRAPGVPRAPPRQRRPAHRGLARGAGLAAGPLLGPRDHRDAGDHDGGRGSAGRPRRGAAGVPRRARAAEGQHGPCLGESRGADGAAHGAGAPTTGDGRRPACANQAGAAPARAEVPASLVR